MGFKYQFVTLAGFHQLNYGMFQLASNFRDRGMGAYSELQQAEFAAKKMATQLQGIKEKLEQVISILFLKLQQVVSPQQLH